MPIEVKELHIKINIDDGFSGKVESELSPAKLKILKAEIIKRCTRDVLEILSEKQQR